MAQAWLHTGTEYITQSHSHPFYFLLLLLLLPFSPISFSFSFPFLFFFSVRLWSIGLLVYRSTTALCIHDQPPWRIQCVVNWVRRWAEFGQPLAVTREMSIVAHLVQLHWVAAVPCHICVEEAEWRSVERVRGTTDTASSGLFIYSYTPPPPPPPPHLVRCSQLVNSSHTMERVERSR